MATNYNRGRYHEFAAVLHLKSLGYTAHRNAGSHGAWDVIGVNATEVRLIQVKAKGKVDAKARGLMTDLAVPACVRLEIWEKVRGGWKVEVLNAPRDTPFTV